MRNKPRLCDEDSHAPEPRQDVFGRGPSSAAFQQWEPTPVFETFWRFATERQAVFYRRASGEPFPWTNDAVLRTFKFTNVYRATDRVSQFLIREVIYKGDQSPRELFFRIILFKLFNRIETWHRLSSRFGEITSNIPIEIIDRELTLTMQAGLKVYSGAYIMPSGTKQFSVERKHSAHLLVLKMMLKDEVPLRVADCREMKSAFTILRSYPLLGDFLAYQFVIDLNYSRLAAFSESEFVVPGPGAKSGLRKCFQTASKDNEIDIIRAVAEHQHNEFLARGLTFQYLGGRPLQLIDCQNLFCEIDKYARAVHPHVRGLANRTRIKQKFAPHTGHIDYWFPPKWDINASFDHEHRDARRVSEAKAAAQEPAF